MLLLGNFVNLRSWGLVGRCSKPLNGVFWFVCFFCCGSLFVCIFVCIFCLQVIIFSVFHIHCGDISQYYRANEMEPADNGLNSQIIWKTSCFPLLSCFSQIFSHSVTKLLVLFTQCKNLCSVKGKTKRIGSWSTGSEKIHNISQSSFIKKTTSNL